MFLCVAVELQILLNDPVKAVVSVQSFLKKGSEHGVRPLEELLIAQSELFFFFQAEDGIRDDKVTGVQTCALPILAPRARAECSASRAARGYRWRRRRGAAAPASKCGGTRQPRRACSYCNPASNPGDRKSVV